MNDKYLEYLDLALVYNPKPHKIQENSILCHLQGKDFKHLLHTEGKKDKEKQLNSIVDLIISGFCNIGKLIKTSNLKNPELIIVRSEIISLQERLDRHQKVINNLISKLTDRLQEIPTKEELYQLIQSLKPKQTNKISEEITSLKNWQAKVEKLLTEIKERSYL